MTKGISISEVIKKIDNILLISAGDNLDFPLNLPAFKRLMMIYPAQYGPVITSERNVKEKYRLLQEFGIVNMTGRINVDRFNEVLKGGTL